MTKGSHRCRLDSRCHRQATGAVLHTWNRLSYGTYGCQEHLEMATERTIARRWYAADMVLIAAREGSRRSVYRPMGPPVGDPRKLRH